MAMDRINGSPMHRPTGVDKFLGTAQNKPGNKAESGSEAKGNNIAQAKPADTMEISDAAHRLVDLRKAVDTGREAINAMPETREDKIALAKKRLEQGYYNSSQVRDDIAAKLGSVFSHMDEL
jgi:hypothetical protein|nr:flagellar biosynthesis anti-sigma factor FlgM [Candidatus Krumholzibacteria bacterium]